MSRFVPNRALYFRGARARLADMYMSARRLTPHGPPERQERHALPHQITAHPHAFGSRRVNRHVKPPAYGRSPSTGAPDFPRACSPAARGRTSFLNVALQRFQIRLRKLPEPSYFSASPLIEGIFASRSSSSHDDCAGRSHCCYAPTLPPRRKPCAADSISLRSPSKPDASILPAANIRGLPVEDLRRIYRRPAARTRLPASTSLNTGIARYWRISCRSLSSASKSCAATAAGG